MKRKLYFALLLGLGILWSFPGYPTDGKPNCGKVVPVDEGAQEPSFSKFRQDLITACKKRNVRFILDHVHPRARGSLGSEEGAKFFLEVWNPRDPKSEFWSTLLSVLQLGGRFSQDKMGKVFMAPYVFTDWPDLDSCDPYGDFVAVMGDHVKVRTKPQHSSSVVAQLNYDVVRVIEDKRAMSKVGEENNSWVHILLPSGKKGFVRQEQVRSPIDYRAGFTQLNGKWFILSLLAGD